MTPRPPAPQSGRSTLSYFSTYMDVQFRLLRKVLSRQNTTRPNPFDFAGLLREVSDQVFSLTLTLASALGATLGLWHDASTIPLPYL